MNSLSRFLRAHAAKIVALGCCLAAFSLALPVHVSAADRSAAAAPFHFTPHDLDAPNRSGDRRVRPVAPAFHHIRSWISSVGAGAGLFAADGGTVSHDVCLVDTRTDTVTVRPVPGTGQRFRPFALTADNLSMPSYAAPMGCLPADLNEDGWQDVTVYYWGRSPVLFMRVPGAAPSEQAFVPRELVPGHPVWNTNAMTVGDYDGDGHPDLVVGGGTDRNLYVMTGNGTGQFSTAETYAAGMVARAVVLRDLNGDHRLDLVCAGFSQRFSVFLHMPS